MTDPHPTILRRAIARAYCETLAEWFRDDPAGLARIRSGEDEPSEVCDDAQLAVDAWETPTGTDYHGSWEHDDSRAFRDRVRWANDALDGGMALAVAAGYDPAAFADAPQRVEIDPWPARGPTASGTE